MNAFDLYRRFTIDELREKERLIKSDLKNQLPGEFNRYTPSARKKLAIISMAIHNHLKSESENNEVKNG